MSGGQRQYTALYNIELSGEFVVGSPRRTMRQVIESKREKNDNGEKISDWAGLDMTNRQWACYPDVIIAVMIIRTTPMMVGIFTIFLASLIDPSMTLNLHTGSAKIKFLRKKIRMCENRINNKRKYYGDEVQTDLMPNTRVMGDVHIEMKIQAKGSHDE